MVPHLLTNKRFKVITIDLRGFGESSYNSSIKEITDFSNDLVEFC